MVRIRTELANGQVTTIEDGVTTTADAQAEAILTQHGLIRPPPTTRRPLFERIFPCERDGRLVQTEWTKGWFDYAAGFGYAAEHLTRHREAFGAKIDQAGVAIFFLQRHRIEMTLKGLLDAAGEDVTDKHALVPLWRGATQRSSRRMLLPGVVSRMTTGNSWSRLIEPIAPRTASDIPWITSVRTCRDPRS